MSIARALLAAAVVVPIVGFSGGCGDTAVKLADAPKVDIPAAKKPEDQPKEVRPRAGSSSGMNYDPSGMGPR